MKPLTDKLTSEQRDKVLDVLFGEGYRHVIHILYDEARVCLNEITVNTSEDERTLVSRVEHICNPACNYSPREQKEMIVELFDEYVMVSDNQIVLRKIEECMRALEYGTHAMALTADVIIDWLQQEDEDE